MKLAQLRRLRHKRKQKRTLIFLQNDLYFLPMKILSIENKSLMGKLKQGV